MLHFILLILISSFCEPDPKLKITHLTGDCYIYTTYKNLDGYKFPSNSMYIVTKEGIVMIDTPWDTTQFQPLLDSMYTRHQKKVILAISTHHHDDRTAGLEFLQKKGVKTYTSKLTYDISKSRNEKLAEFIFYRDTTFTIGHHTFETYYPGKGHTSDNIVIWLKKDKILYGGCLVKSIENNSLGNIKDADTEQWENSIKNVIKKYDTPVHVIPGHFNWSDEYALQHTLKLVRQHQKKN